MVQDLESEVKRDKLTNCWSNDDYTFLIRREERRYFEGMENECQLRPKETQNLSYPPRFKLEVALYARDHSQYSAAKLFSVARRRIFDWMQQVNVQPTLALLFHKKSFDPLCADFKTGGSGGQGLFQEGDWTRTQEQGGGSAAL